MIETGFLAKEVPLRRTADDGKVVPLTARETGGRDRRLRACPKCGESALVRQEGCDSCTSCGYSRCS